MFEVELLLDVLLGPVLVLLVELVLLLSAAHANGTSRAIRKMHKIPSFAFIKISGKTWVKQPAYRGALFVFLKKTRHCAYLKLHRGIRAA